MCPTHSYKYQISCWNLRWRMVIKGVKKTVFNKICLHKLWVLHIFFITEQFCADGPQFHGPALRGQSFHVEKNTPITLAGLYYWWKCSFVWLTAPLLWTPWVDRAALLSQLSLKYIKVPGVSPNTVHKPPGELETSPRVFEQSEAAERLSPSGVVMACQCGTPTRVVSS